jgi:hypothetical protein
VSWRARPQHRAHRVRRGITWAAAAVAVLPVTFATAMSAPAAPDSIRYVSVTTDANLLGLAITNYGFFGNNFNSRSPSFEYPLGSGTEHMSRAGLWVGAVALDGQGSFTGVSAAIVDNVQGSSGAAETEFTPAGNAIRQRSRISNNRFFSPLAVSDQDFDSEYSDVPERAPAGNQRERHRPLDILVRQQTLGFSLRAAQDFVVVRFTIINRGAPLRDAFVGLYAQLVSGDKNAYSSWPPSSTSGPGSWYYKTYAEFDSTRRLYKERYCQQLPYPGSCNFAFAPPWAAVKLLRTSPGAVDQKRMSFNWWTFSPGDTSRDEDVERYVILSNGRTMDPRDCIPGGQNCSPIMVLSIGPWAQIDPGDSVTVDFAFVGGSDEPALLANADFAQFAADIDYRLPAPPPSPRVHVETARNRVDIYWDDSPESEVDPTSLAPGGQDFEGYRVYFGSDRQAPIRVAQLDRSDAPNDTTGFNTGFDTVRLSPPRVIDGIPYAYRFSVPDVLNGFNYYGAVTSYDLGDVQVESLESGISQNKFLAVPNARTGEAGGDVVVYPNPYRVEARWDRGRQVRDHYLWFANLPSRCVLRIYTLSGDRIFETRFDGSSYSGQGTRGLYDPRSDLDTAAPALSGASFAWNMISANGQAIASGLYLYAVENLDGGAVSRGKFLIVKSDREN